MNIGFIGAGKAGFTLDKYFSAHGIEVTGYYSRNIRSARDAAAFISSNVYGDAAGVLSKSDVLFLTVPDGSIRPTYEALARGDIRGKIFCHASGALTAAAAFPGIRQKGASGFSVHPLLAISDRYRSYRELADCFFTLEGPEENLCPARPARAGGAPRADHPRRGQGALPPRRRDREQPRLRALRRRRDTAHAVRLL